MASQQKSPRRIGAVELARETNLGRPLLTFNDDEVVQLLKAAVEHEENQTAFARRHGIERTHFNQILHRKKGVNRSVLKALGLRKVYAPK
jgi:DNA-binding phage protein